ncbi:MFS transporter, PPP family, 3-phenylpropionic acid transporter [Strigomonas culicis]|uniref:MFS transporter, PPP family, 3-phenylpropionic acid transporter n=1 Tax=Strigomonas culicis TaxID=28005 RepID=S9W1N6_9TRYP|nr:MFS transporter, PPP family, 3-phenylpropionic acid transporter [Strigomonas culicis]|eukprot:EPY29685.1 MFS transporter, PPP family, 3-phenylpropionic acid transporter [Strigomonas culicis]
MAEGRNNLISRVGYFFVYGGLSACKPYYILLLKDKGFSERTAGYMLVLLPLSSLVALSPLALAADRFHCAREIMFCGGALTCLSFIVLIFLSNPSTALVTFLLFFHFLGICPLFPFFDNRVLSTLTEDRRKEWGSLRCFGSFGWGLCSALSYTLKGLWGWWVSALFLVVGLAIAMGAYVRIEPRSTAPPTKRNFIEVLQYVSHHRRTVAFLLTACLSGFGYTLISSFLPAFLQSIEASSFLQGLAVTMTVVAEIPIFHYAGFIHNRLTDRQLLAISLLGWSFRALCYAVLYNPWLVLLIEPLHGVSFGCMWLAGIHFVNGSFPANLSHSAIGFLGAAVFGVGPVVGNALGGEMYGSWTPRWMYARMALVIALASVAFYIVDRKLEASELAEAHEIVIEGDELSNRTVSKQSGED